MWSRRLVYNSLPDNSSPEGPFLHLYWFQEEQVVPLVGGTDHLRHAWKILAYSAISSKFVSFKQVLNPREYMMLLKLKRTSESNTVGGSVV